VVHDESIKDIVAKAFSLETQLDQYRIDHFIQHQEERARAIWDRDENASKISATSKQGYEADSKKRRDLMLAVQTDACINKNDDDGQSSNAEAGLKLQSCSPWLLNRLFETILLYPRIVAGSKGGGNFSNVLPQTWFGWNGSIGNGNLCYSGDGNISYVVSCGGKKTEALASSIFDMFVWNEFDSEGIACVPMPTLFGAVSTKPLFSCITCTQGPVRLGHSSISDEQLTQKQMLQQRSIEFDRDSSVLQFTPASISQLGKEKYFPLGLDFCVSTLDGVGCVGFISVERAVKKSDVGSTPGYSEEQWVLETGMCDVFNEDSKVFSDEDVKSIRGIHRWEHSIVAYNDGRILRNNVVIFVGQKWTSGDVISFVAKGRLQGGKGGGCLVGCFVNGVIQGSWNEMSISSRVADNIENCSQQKHRYGCDMFPIVGLETLNDTIHISQTTLPQTQWTNQRKKENWTSAITQMWRPQQAWREVWVSTMQVENFQEVYTNACTVLSLFFQSCSVAKGKVFEIVQEQNLCYHLLNGHGMGGASNVLFSAVETKAEDGDVMSWLREKMSPKNINGAGEHASISAKDTDDILGDHLLSAQQDPVDIAMHDDIPLNGRLKAFTGYLGDKSVAKDFMCAVLWHCAQCLKISKGASGEVSMDDMQHMKFLEGPLAIIKSMLSIYLQHQQINKGIKDTRFIVSFLLEDLGPATLFVFPGQIPTTFLSQKSEAVCTQILAMIDVLDSLIQMKDGEISIRTQNILHEHGVVRRMVSLYWRHDSSSILHTKLTRFFFHIIGLIPWTRPRDACALASTSPLIVKMQAGESALNEDDKEEALDAQKRLLKECPVLHELLCTDAGLLARMKDIFSEPKVPNCRIHLRRIAQQVSVCAKAHIEVAAILYQQEHWAWLLQEGKCQIKFFV
jgi:hypothetical protein